MTLWSTEAHPEISADRGFKSLRAHTDQLVFYQDLSQTLDADHCEFCGRFIAERSELDGTCPAREEPWTCRA